MPKKDIDEKRLKKELRKDWQLLKDVYKNMFREAFFGLWDPIRHLLVWIWDRFSGFIRRLTKAFTGLLPWLIFTILITFWFFTATRLPVYVWNLTQDFDSQKAYSEANKLDGELLMSELNFAEQVSQGVLLERQGDLQGALQKYQSAEKSRIDTTRNYSHMGLQRVQQRLSYPLWQPVYMLNNFLIKTPQWILLAVGTVLAILGLLFVYYRIPITPGFAIGEFNTPKSIDKELEFGIEVRQTLADTIALIQLTHRTAQEALPLLTERLVVPNFGLSGGDKEEVLQALFELGDAPVLQTTGISIAKLLNIFQLASQRRQYILIGSLNKLDDQWYLSAKAIDTRNRGLINQWEIRQSELAELTFSSDESNRVVQAVTDQAANIIRKLSRALAYKILYTILKQNAPSLEAKSWKSFYHLTEGLWGLQEFSIDSSAKDPRDRAVMHLERLVNQLDYGNRLARFDLGLFYMLQGDITKVQHVFDYLKSSIDAQPEALLDKIYKNLIENKSEGKSMISRYLWKKYAKEFKDISLQHRGGVLPGMANSWKQFLPEIGDYLRNPGLKAFNKLSITTSLKLYLDDDDIRISFRKLARLSENSSTVDATKSIMGILEDGDEAQLIQLIKSLKGEDEETRAAWEEISKVLDEKHIQELSREFHRIETELDLLKIMDSFLEDEQKVKDLARKILELAKKAQPPIIRRFLAGLVNRLLEDDWKKVEIIRGALRQYLIQSSPYESRFHLQRLLLDTDAPRLIRFYALLQPEKTGDYLALYDWQYSKRQPIYVESLYNLAQGHYLAFSPAGFTKSIEICEVLIEHLKIRDKLAVDPRRCDELSKIAICLTINSWIRLYLLHWSTLELDYMSDEKDSHSLSDISKELDEIEKGYFSKHLNIQNVLDLTRDKSIDVRVAACETMGLWTAYKNHYIGEDHDVYFKSALSLRSWASSYIYIAESRAARKEYFDALQLLKIAKQQMPSLKYISYLENVWQAKIEQKDDEQLGTASIPVDVDGIPD